MALTNLATVDQQRGYAALLSASLSGMLLPSQEPTAAEVVMLSKVESAYQWRNPMRIGQFLRKETYLLPILVDLPVAIASSFGGGVPLAISVVSYGAPFIDDEIDVAVRTRRDVDDARLRMDAFDEAWWLDAMMCARGKMSVSLEFY
jgi:hypothetical protein